MKKIVITILLFALILASFSFSNKETAATINVCDTFITHTQSQSLGLTLKSGKSAVTSTDYMRKRDCDSLYAVNDLYYSFAAKGINDFVNKSDIQAAATMTFMNGLYSVNDGQNGWSTCAGIDTSIKFLSGVYSDGIDNPISGDHLYLNAYGTANTNMVNNDWYYFSFNGIRKFIQVTNTSGLTTIVYADTTCSVTGTNVRIRSSGGAITRVNNVDVWAYATQVVNTDVVVSVHIVGDNGGTADVNVTIHNGSRSGSMNINLGSGILSSITDCHITSLSPPSYSGYNYIF